jgi:hypothetical protein
LVVFNRFDLLLLLLLLGVCSYISKVQQQHPGCRGLAGGGNAPAEGPAGALIPSSHQKLLHRCAAYACTVALHMHAHPEQCI